MNKSLKNISLNWGNIPKICEYFPTLEKPTKFGKCSQKIREIFSNLKKLPVGKYFVGIYS